MRKGWPRLRPKKSRHLKLIRRHRNSQELSSRLSLKNANLKKKR